MIMKYNPGLNINLAKNLW